MFFIYEWFCLFISGSTGSSLPRGLFSSSRDRGSPSRWCMGSSLRWLLLLWNTGSWLVGFNSRGTRAPEHRFSGYGPWAALLRGMQGLLAQRSNPCPSHWQVDSLPLSLQGSPCLHLYDKLWAEFSNKQRTHWSSPPGSVLLQDTVFLFAFPILVTYCGVLKKWPLSDRNKGCKSEQVITQFALLVSGQARAGIEALCT